MSETLGMRSVLLFFWQRIGVDARLMSVLLAVFPALAFSNSGRSDQVRQALGIDDSYTAYFYTLNHASFSDYAVKVRHIYLPDGRKAKINVDLGLLEFPEGTLIVKEFYFYALPNKLCYDGTVHAHALDQRVGEGANSSRCQIEIRTLRLVQGQWKPKVYVWRASGRQLVETVTGDSQDIYLYKKGVLDTHFRYSVPDLGECAQCHQGALGVDLKFEVIGPSMLRRLDLKKSDLNFLSPAALANLNLWTQTATKNESGVAETAREYLDINCAHCHNPKGLAASSNLFLMRTVPPSIELGFCKPVVASGATHDGRLYDIVPGYSSESVLIHRMHSTDPIDKMPEIGRNLVDTQGLVWVSAWIDSLKGGCYADG